MSAYNTRRSPAGRGGGNTQTQVMYHSGSVGSNVGRGNSRMPPSEGYSTSATQNFPQQQFVSQGYSTAPPPAPAPAVQKSSPAPTAPVQQMPMTAPPPTSQPSAPLIKSESQPNPLKQEQQQQEQQRQEHDQHEQQQQETNGEEQKQQRPHWRKKGPSVKVSRKTKKRWQNARLRRLLTPKNALMFLNELHSGAKFTCQERLNALSQFVYTVTVEVDGKVFTGQGMSKLAAKSQASENALKVLVLEMMTKTQNVTEQNTEPEADVEMGEEEPKESAACGDEIPSESTKRRPLPEDDLPWGSLAAFALHKLFAEWQQQGTQVPLAVPAKIPAVVIPVREQTSNEQPKAIGPAPIKKIPEDASKIHPVLLMNHLRPGSQYKEILEGVPPNMFFTTTLNIDGKEYAGSGKNKKEAKKECAKAALAAMGIQSEF